MSETSEVGRPPRFGLPTSVVALVALGSIVVVVAGMRTVSGLVGPIFLALVLIVAVSPLIGWLRSRRVPAWAAIVATVSLLYALLIGFAVLMIYSMAQLAELMPQYSGRAAELVGGLRSTLQDVGIGEEQARAIGDQLSLDRLPAPLRGLGPARPGPGRVGVCGGALRFSVGTGAVGPGRGRGAVTPPGPPAAAPPSAFAHASRRYLVVATVFGLAVALVDTVALFIIGIPLPILWGLLSFVTNYIPNIGFFIGLAPPALLGLLSGGPEAMLAVIVVYCLVNFVIQSLIQPKVVGDTVGLSVTVTFAALAFWTWVIGPLGAILAIPLTLFAKAMLIDRDPTTRWMNILIDARPPAETVPTPAPAVDAVATPSLVHGSAVEPVELSPSPADRPVVGSASPVPTPVAEPRGQT